MYRAKVKSSDPVISKRWAYGDKATVEGRTFIIPDDAEIKQGPAPFGKKDIIVGSVEVIPESVGQSTGVKDKDGIDEKWEQEGTEIFEGDRIRFVPAGRSGKMRHTGIVYYNMKASGFWVKGKVWDCPLDMCTYREVIDDPKLLQETDR